MARPKKTEDTVERPIPAALDLPEELVDELLASPGPPTLVNKTAIWDSLAKTDEKYTKSFNRSGGFKGTAIKPIYSVHKMTEQFGPCGVGWGTTAPVYTFHDGYDEERLVFCTLGLWYVTDGFRSFPVYGVGGDKIVVKSSTGSRNSDEAMKAAYTDALTNAMKLIGVGADIHFGLFDDSKYLRDIREEFSENPTQPVGAPTPKAVVESVTLPPFDMAPPPPVKAPAPVAATPAKAAQAERVVEPYPTEAEREALKARCRGLVEKHGLGSIGSGLLRVYLCRSGGVANLADLTKPAYETALKHVESLSKEDLLQTIETPKGAAA